MKPAPTNVSRNGDYLSRRQFLQTSSLVGAGVAVASQLPFVITAHAAPDDPIRIGLIGCGGRGTGAVADALGAATDVHYPQAGYHTENISANARMASSNVQVVALADVFADRLNSCREQLGRLNISIANERCFVGFEAYKHLLAVPEVNYVILAQPPHFRPSHLKAAIEAGKHVFMEKPAAVDGPGVKLVMGSGRVGAAKETRDCGRDAAAPPAQLQPDYQTAPGRGDRRVAIRACLLERWCDLGGGTPNWLERYGMAIAELELLHMAFG